jgi:hypothetical protein
MCFNANLGKLRVGMVIVDGNPKNRYLSLFRFSLNFAIYGGLSELPFLRVESNIKKIKRDRVSPGVMAIFFTP